MNTKYVTHIIEPDENPLIVRTTLHSKFIFILTKIYLMLGPHQCLFYFCMNQFHGFHHLELQNMIIAYLKKHFKKQKRCENGLPGRKVAAKFY